MTIDPVALVRRYHAALNAYDAAVVGPMFATDAVYVSPGVSGRLAGREAIITAFDGYFAEHPDQYAVDEAIEQLSPLQARARWQLEATQRSSGRRIRRRGSETVTFGTGGLIVHVEVTDR